MDGGVGFHFTEGARYQYYPLMIGMEGATEKRTKLCKGTSVGLRKVCFFRCYTRKSSLKNTVMR